MSTNRKPPSSKGDLATLAETYLAVKDLVRKSRNYFTVQEKSKVATTEQLRDHKQISEVIEKMLPPRPPGPAEDLEAMARSLTLYFKTAGRDAYIIQELCGYVLPEHISAADLQEVFNSLLDTFSEAYLVFSDQGGPKLMLGKDFLSRVVRDAMEAVGDQKIVSNFNSKTGDSDLVGVVIPKPEEKEKLIDDVTTETMIQLGKTQTFQDRAPVSEESLRSAIADVDLDTIRSFVITFLEGSNKQGTGK